MKLKKKLRVKHNQFKF